MSEMSADVGEGTVLTGGTEAVSISRHSAPSFGGSLTSRSVRAVCQRLGFLQTEKGQRSSLASQHRPLWARMWLECPS